MHKLYRSSAQTRHKIIQQAVELFNEGGTDAISTNHIAEAAAISPGNLYYHFHNKEEIIRAILEQMILDWNALYQPLDAENFDQDVLRQLLENSFGLTWKYRFFYRELVALLRKDDQLRQDYRALQQRRLADQTAFITRFAQLNGRRFLEDAAELNNSLRVAWILGDTWILHLETMGQPVNEQTIREGVALVLQVLKPTMAGRHSTSLRDNLMS
jgi:AcrR family transcriptional regulator